MKNEINSNQKNHIGNALIFMCRYAYTRNTSADMACNSALKALWEFIPDGHRKIIIDEIKSEAELGNITSNPFLWNDFLNWIDK